MESWIKIYGEFVYRHKKLYFAGLILISAGGFIGDFLGWPFSLLVPAFFAYSGWIMARRYKKNI